MYKEKGAFYDRVRFMQTRRFEDDDENEGNGTVCILFVQIHPNGIQIRKGSRVPEVMETIALQYQKSIVVKRRICRRKGYQ
jgi:hypothetical protein